MQAVAVAPGDLSRVRRGDARGRFAHAYGFGRATSVRSQANTPARDGSTVAREVPANPYLLDGRGGFRTCDLSRVKHDPEADEEPPEQGQLF
jgi:hypothetical protein